MTTYHDLTAPPANLMARSQALTNVIQQKIQQHNGCISFAEFMQSALYDPQLGYYQQENFTLGKHGDFTTAPEISPLFTYCFAKQAREILMSSGTSAILELGAGSGRFALDFMMDMDAEGSLPECYFIYEISTALREKQRALIAAKRPDLLARMVWLSELPPQFAGVIIANEVLDAVPFHCFEVRDQQPMARMVASHESSFIWQLEPISTPELSTPLVNIIRECSLTDGYQSEINLASLSLVDALSRLLTTGVILFADYGYGQREYYHPERRHGTLTCFYQHRKLNDPFIYPGLMDITAHVDFTSVIETAAASGAALSGFTTQSAFLLANGLLDMAQKIEDSASQTEAFNMHQAIKTLTMPTEMGDVIKIMAISKNISFRLTGFTLLDRRRDL